MLQLYSSAGVRAVSMLVGHPHAAGYPISRTMLPSPFPRAPLPASVCHVSVPHTVHSVALSVYALQSSAVCGSSCQIQSLFASRSSSSPFCPRNLSAEGWLCRSVGTPALAGLPRLLAASEVAPPRIFTANLSTAVLLRIGAHSQIAVNSERESTARLQFLKINRSRISNSEFARGLHLSPT